MRWRDHLEFSPTPIPTNGAEQCAWLEATAKHFVESSRGEYCENVLVDLATRAIARWCLGEARMWHRVKYRARLIRARRRG